MTYSSSLSSVSPLHLLRPIVVHIVGVKTFLTVKLLLLPQIVLKLYHLYVKETYAFCFPLIIINMNFKKQ